MREDTGSQNYELTHHMLGQALLDLWLEGDENRYKVSLEKLGDHLIDYGLVGTWQAHRLRLITLGNDSSELQREKIESLLINAQSLINEIIALEENRTVKDEVRLLGLITVALSGGQELPSSIIVELSPSRQAIDLYCLASFMGRNFDGMRIVCEALKRNNCQSRTMDAVLYYSDVKKTSLIQRGEQVRNEEPMLMTPWEVFNTVITELCSAIHDIHCLEWIDARKKCTGILNVYSQCGEARWLESAICLCNYNTPTQATWTMFKECELLGASYIERTKSLVRRDEVRNICRILERDRGWGMDQAYERLARSIEIHNQHIDGAYDKVDALIEDAADTEMANSTYDPFELTLFASHLERIEFHSYRSVSSVLQVSEIGLLIVTGPSGPYMSNLERLLKTSGFNGLVRLDDCFEAMIIAIEQRFKKKYPQDIMILDEHEIFELRKFLWQNIAFTHGDKDCSRLVWCSDRAYRYIGLAWLLFEDCISLCCLPPLRELVIAQFAQMAGYSHRHATATLSELVAYQVDYSLIADRWKLLTNEKLLFVLMTGHAGEELLGSCSEILGVEFDRSSIDSEESIRSLLPCRHQYERLFMILEEFEEDFDTIENIFAEASRS